LHYENADGKVSLPHLYSRPGKKSPLARTRKIPPQLQLPHPSGFLIEISNLISSRFPDPNQSPPQKRTQSLHPPLPPSPNHRPLASLLCPTSRSQMFPMTSPPPAPHSRILLTTNFSSIPRPWFHMRHSTSMTETWKSCAGIHSSVSLPAFCPSTPQRFVGCSPRPTSLLQSHPTVVPVFCPRTPPRISPRSSR